MFLDYSEYIRAITRELEARPVRVSIATFNAHVGVSARGGVFPTDTHKLLEVMNKTTRDSRVLVGLGPSLGEDVPRRLTNCQEFFPFVMWKTKANCHLKCWIFHYRNGTVKALVGGRNLGDSEWADVSVFLDHRDSKRLLQFYESLWAQGRQVNRSSIKLLVGGKKIR